MGDLAEPPDSSPEFAALACLLFSVLGDRDAIDRALEGASDIAGAVSAMDLAVVRLRSQRHDAKVRQDFSQAQAWLSALRTRFRQLPLA